MSPDEPQGGGTSAANETTGRMRRDSKGPEGGVFRRFLSRWGFALFVIFVAFIGRGVLLPFVFASLIAYILAPIVARMSTRPDGKRRMSRGVAIILCYIAVIAGMTGFMLLLVPRLSHDFARLGKEAPNLYKRINEEWTPSVAHWLEGRFPSLATVKTQPDEASVMPEAGAPPGTAFTVTPLADGRLAVQLSPSGVDIKPTSDGGYRVQTFETSIEPVTLEDKLRAFVKKALVGLQSKLNDAVRVLQDVITGFIRGIFSFFFTLMIGAFLLIDLDKVHAFLRSLFPANMREDYDVIASGIDHGLSGVIRGQLLICVINACFTYIGLLVFGVKYTLIFAMVAGMMSLVPIFGSILSSVPIVAVALVSGDEGVDVIRGFAILLWIIGIHLVEANVLNPKIIGTAAKIHPVLVIFALFFGEASFGLVGALLAVPLLSAIQVVFMYLYRKQWKEAGRGASGPIKLPEPPPAPELAPTKR